jgi:diguanylate cyclase (GGDEF)-like protein
MFPHALRFELLAPDARLSQDADWPFLTASNRAFLQHALQRRIAPLPQYHANGTIPPHIDFAQPLLDTVNGRHLGILYVSVDASWLLQHLRRLLDGRARVQLIEIPDRTNPSRLINQVGAVPPSHITRVTDSNLGIAYWPAPGGGVPTARHQRALLVTGATLAAILTLIIWLIERRLGRAIQHDIRSVASMIRDLREDKIRLRYTIRLQEFKNLLSYINKSGGKLLRERRKLQDLGLTDHLTKLSNRRALEMKIEELYVQARVGIASSVLLIDLDYFKQVNDRHGHDAGDVLISKFGRALKQAVRHSDVVARLGGDEFCVIFPYTNIQYADELAHRVREQVPRQVEIKPGIKHQISWTGGLAVMSQYDKKADDALWRADKALLQAKNAGRNRTWVYSSPAKAGKLSA